MQRSLPENPQLLNQLPRRRTPRADLSELRRQPRKRSARMLPATRMMPRRKLNLKTTSRWRSRQRRRARAQTEHRPTTTSRNCSKTSSRRQIWKRSRWRPFARRFMQIIRITIYHSERISSSRQWNRWVAALHELVALEINFPSSRFSSSPHNFSAFSLFNSERKKKNVNKTFKYYKTLFDNFFQLMISLRFLIVMRRGVSAFMETHTLHSFFWGKLFGKLHWFVA